ncbi:MAG: EAL domain-containing protein [Pseudomonadota bacterium]|nr:EAL domain-containing protein [Pseudomonadota bacterium]MDP1903017.1 EAL domain-containing protein [Pseudomonadota bacterium]MDP2352211.1 EAL domain-containing protein [Pseudomonadota bacterium]
MHSDPELASPLVSLLIIEDEPRYLESSRLLLAPHLHRIDTALTGAQARALLARQSYDLVLLDLRLPDASGHDLLASLRERHPGTLVIIMSGNSQIDSAINCIRLGAYDYLRKPCEPEELIKTLRNAAQKVRLARDNQQMQRQLEHSEQWHRLLINTSPDVIYTLDGNGEFTFLNERVSQVLGYPPDELVGRHYEIVVPEDERENARYLFNERRTGTRATHNAELRLKRKEDLLSGEGDGGVMVEISAMGMYRPRPDGSGEFLGTYGVARDISARKQAEATVTFQAYHDLLTGLPNRALFNDRVIQAIAQARRHGQALAVMFLDMDRFKVVNDSLGHLVGDGLLQGMAQRLRDSLREGDTLARIGGDEFMLLLPRVRSRDNAAFIAQKIITSLQQPFLIDGNEIYSGMSIGIAVYPDDGDNLETLVKHADLAMYHAKDHGRNDFRFFTHDLRHSLTGRLAVENDMRHALARGEFELYYQPQVDIQSQRIRGMEALIRWHHPERGLVSPNDFIPIAEECGLIAPISEWVLDAACKQALSWRAAKLPPVTLGVNLSARQIEHPHFVDKFIQSLHDHGIDGQGIEIELTESTLMRDMEGAIEKLRRLADQGVEISIDDFGTGYSSLSYLKKLPVHTLKIDRSFIQDLIAPSNGGTIVAGITAMAKGLRLNVVAEGVETKTQLDYLESIGCDAYQGYLFSRPVAACDATGLLQLH